MSLQQGLETKIREAAANELQQILKQKTFTYVQGSKNNPILWSQMIVTEKLNTNGDLINIKA